MLHRCPLAPCYALRAVRSELCTTKKGGVGCADDNGQVYR